MSAPRVAVDALLPLTVIAAATSKRRSPVSARTLSTWSRRGVAMADGTRLFLPAVKIGGRLCCTLRQYAEFCARARAGVKRATWAKYPG
jgi:hypothetical protein